MSSMDRLYRFSPIQTESKLLEAIQYVAKRASELSEEVINQVLPITSLTIFSHYPEEFENLKQLSFKLGQQSSENNGPYVKLHMPVLSSGNTITHIRIRQPDPYRMQVGCNDFDVKNYQEFKEKYLSQNHSNLRLIERPEYEMIEFFHPDFDVLSYVVSD